MPLAGAAALAMWWDMDPVLRAEFEDWHSNEHWPERLALPGFLRASRWADATGGEGFFVLYELAGVAALTSPEYLARLNAPTDWSRRLMPHHRNMVRSPCVVVRSEGSAEASHAVTVRLAGDASAASLQALVDSLAALPGVAGVHLLQAQRQAIAATTEHRIRGSADQVADWTVLLYGQDGAALAPAADAALARAKLPDAMPGRYTLRLRRTAGPG
jgi:hypothetical protein